MTAFADTFPKGVDCVSAFAPTGEDFDVLSEGGFPSIDAAEKAARCVFNAYAGTRSGNLYWRVPPEIGLYGKGRYRQFYMRLLISDKDVKQ